MSPISADHLFATVSGLYTRREWIGSGGSGPALQKIVVASVRLDVDGSFPQMLASGTYGTASLLEGTSEWLAIKLKETTSGVWEGDIVRTSDPQVLPHRKVRIEVPRHAIAVSASRMTITYTGGASDITSVLDFESPYFRTVDFEFDTVETAPKVTSVDTWAHPNRPANLKREHLSIAEVYSRVGVDVQQSPNASDVGLEAGVGADLWDDQQLHDAMQMFWSRYRPRSQWALWVLFAHRHVNPLTLGIMFDTSTDAIQRQGAAIFGERIAERVTSGESHPAQWIRREEFFATVHEIGHCFNLVHSFEKQSGTPWSLDPGDPLASSFMNYPRQVEKLGANFWGAFEYRFDNPELAFIRHAPDELVMMGAAAYGFEHGFRDVRPAIHPRLQLALTVGRARPVFEFLEPVTVELTLTNMSKEPQLVSASLLDEFNDLSLVIEPRGGVAQRWRPYARRCSFGAGTWLQPRQSLKTALFVSAGLDGWHLAEPGSYTMHASITSPSGFVVAEPLILRVAAPRSREEDYVAQNFFTDEVGRALAFGGSHVMAGAIDALREVADRLEGRTVARHALLTLARPLMRNGKVLRLRDGESPMSSVAADGGKIATIEARPDEAQRLLENALLGDTCAARETFGALAYQHYVEMYADWLHECGDTAGADKARTALADAV